MPKTDATPILRDLHIFALAAGTQNLSATAEKFHVTPAAISKSVKRLEKIFGTRMFIRTGRGLTLTTAGRVVYSRCKSLDDLISLMHTEVADVNAAGAELVRLGASPVMTARVVAPAIAKLVSNRPATQIELYSQPSDRLLDDLENGLLDIAIAVLPNAVSPTLRYDKLGITRSYIIGRRGHPLLRRGFNLEDLQKQNWMVAPNDARWISSVLANAGISPPAFTVKTDTSPAGLASVIAGSDLLSIVDLATLESKLVSSLAIFPAPAPWREARFGLFWRKHTSFSAAMKRCRIELMRAYGENKI
jgi:DNA-binding transcriptional LysR family regulator